MGRVCLSLHEGPEESYLDFYKTFINQDRCKNTPYLIPASFYYGHVRRILANADAFMEAMLRTWNRR